MGMLKFKAAQIFDGHRLWENKVLITQADGTIEAIVEEAAAGESVRHVEGILMPGLVNCHCHLELSHLKEVIAPHTGLIEFLCSVVTKRNFPAELIQEKIKEAEQEMAQNGIVAVGDIGNTADTAAVKASSSICWQNFVEVLSFTDEKAADAISHYQSALHQLKQSLSNSSLPHRSSLVPHAPYSVSPETFRRLNELTQEQVISIHNQEHPAENELYQQGGGDYLKLFKIFGMDRSPFPVTGLSSLRSILPYFDRGQTILLVHNTCSTQEEIEWANEYANKKGIRLQFCLCINANLYIEYKIPPVGMLYRSGSPVVIGTDSYSSNWQLSIASEIKTLRRHAPEVPLETLLHWATLQGARALHWDDKLGSFEKGKKPGLTSLDLEAGTSQRIPLSPASIS
jgi:cytosine/adenosine deaminase-related metal-dependent hydrolase